MERPVIEVGARVQSPDWEGDEYATVTAVGERRFLGVPSWAEHSTEDTYNLSDRWIRLPDPLPTVPATNDVWVARWITDGRTEGAVFWHEPTALPWHEPTALPWVRNYAEHGRLVDVWRIPADGPPERVEVTA